jgi:hypothetical protein
VLTFPASVAGASRTFALTVAQNTESIGSTSIALDGVEEGSGAAGGAGATASGVNAAYRLSRLRASSEKFPSGKNFKNDS